MSTVNARCPFAILGAVILASGLGIAGSAKAADGQPTTQMQNAAADEQTVLRDILGAEADVTHGRRLSTLNHVEEAETTLLNAQQAGEYHAPQALAALEQAKADLRSRSAKVEVHDLQTAEVALPTTNKS